MPLIRLTKDQLFTVRQELRTIYGSAAKMEDLLMRLNRSFAELSVSGSNLRENLLAVIKAAEAEGWLLDLVQTMRGDVPDDPVLQELEQELIPLAPPRHVDYFDVCCLTGSRVMVDRAPLRSSLKLLSMPLGKRILVVTGDTKSGKSHSVQLMSYLTEVRGGFSLILIDLEAFRRLLGADEIIQPLDVAQGLVKKLRYGFQLPERPTDAQWARWVLNFCDDLEAHAQEDDQFRWVVIDGFTRVVLAQATLDLIKELAVRVNQSLTRFRLVLLGYDNSFPPVVLPQVEQEFIRPIRERDLTEFFGRAFRQHEIPYDEDKLVASVSHVLADIDPASEDFLFRLEARVIDELVRAAEQVGGS